MKWEIREFDPSRDSRGNIYYRVEIRCPSVEVQGLGAYEIGAILKDQVLVILWGEFEKEEPSS